MRKIVLLSAVVILGLSSCLKNSNQRCPYSIVTVTAPDDEIASLKDSLDKYQINAQQHVNGFFYHINQPGDGTTAIKDLCSAILVSYRGTFFNGKVFDSTATGKNIAFNLGELILGWQKGIPLITKGGDIDLYIPPSLAYGDNDRKDANDKVIMPGKSYLVFNMKLVDLQNNP